MQPNYVIHLDRSRVEGLHHFPLPMAPMEKFMLWDDSSTHPKRFRVSCEFTGQMNRDRLRESLQFAVARHPMLLVVPDLRSNPKRWLIPQQPSFALFDPPGTYCVPPEEYKARIQNWKEFDALCVWLDQDESRSEVVFDYHHACCDGMGARQFVRDWLLAYEQLVQSGTIDKSIFPRLDGEMLLHRNRFRVVEPEADVRPTTILEKIQHAYHFHCLPPHSIRKLDRKSKAGNPVSGQPPKQSESIVVQRTILDLTEQDVLERVKASGTNLNDIAVSLLLQTLSEWCDLHNQKDAKKRLRIMIPADLRGIEHRKLSAANRFGFAFVVAKGSEVQHWETALTSIGPQLEKIRKLRLGLDFLQILGWAQSIPVVSMIARRLVRSGGCGATAVLSNMGDVTRRLRRNHATQGKSPQIGDLVLTSVTGLPPLRPETSFGVGLTMAAGQLSVATIVDTKALGSRSLELHGHYVNRWRELISTLPIINDKPSELLATQSHSGDFQ